MAAKKLCDHYTVCAVQIVDSEGWWLLWSSCAIAWNIMKFKEASNSQCALLLKPIAKGTEQSGWSNPSNCYQVLLLQYNILIPQTSSLTCWSERAHAPYRTTLSVISLPWLWNQQPECMAIDRALPTPAHQRKALGTNKSVRSFC